jgi:signal transduction histidine kinase/tetratricopeptide (TPR) repeat protein
MNKTILIILFCSSQFLSFSQKKGQAKIDSMIAEIPKIKNDTLKVRTYNRIAEEYFFIDTDKAMQFCKIGLKLGTKMNWTRSIAVTNAAIGRAFSDKGNYDSSMIYYNRALEINTKAKDYWNMSSVLNNMGVVEQNIKSDYPKATKYYIEALKAAENLPDKYVSAVCYDNISTIYLFQKNYPKALDYGFRGLRLRESLSKIAQTSVDNSREIGNSLTSIGNIYVEMKDWANAKDYTLKAIKIHQKVGNKEGLANAYSNLAMTFQTDYRKQIELGLKAKNLWNEVNPNHLEAIGNLANIGTAYLDLVRNDTLNKLKNERKTLLNQAENYLQKAIKLSEQNGETANKAQNVGNLAELQALKGDYRNAYNNFRAYQNAQDSLYSQQSKNEIAGLESKREIELRDKEIELNKLALENQKKQQIALFIGLGLLVIIGGLLFWQNQTRKRTNITLLRLNSELDEANKIKAKFFAILSHDLRSPVANLISFLNLQKNAPDLLTPEIKERNQQKITTSAEGLLETMESMLLWSKGQMQNFKPQEKQIEVREVFEYLQKFFANTQNVSIIFENKNNLSVVTDEDYLKTIMQNLTNNAIKALKNTPNAQITWQARQEGEQIVLSIIDNGEGVSEQQLKTLYSDEAAIGSKTGLGLHLIRDLAKAIACKIAVKSTPNHGSEFQLIFGGG